MSLYYLVIMLALLAVLVGLGLCFPILVGKQARRRGYSGIIWFLAVIFSLNRLLIIVVLTVLPDRKKLRLREEERKKLEVKLAAVAVAIPAPPTRPVTVTSLGDQSTAAPSARSIGDEETRG
jgi:hypothetical protein